MSRLIRNVLCFCIGFALMAISMLSFAGAFVNSLSPPGSCFSDKAAACSAYCASTTLASGYTDTCNVEVYNGTDSCIIRTYYNGSETNGYVATFGSCTYTDPCTATLNDPPGTAFVDGDGFGTRCAASGCSYNFTQVVGGDRAKRWVNGVEQIFFEATTYPTGQSCTYDPGANTPSYSQIPESTCDPATQDQGTINGQVYCLARSTTTTTNTTSTTDSQTGTTTKTTTTTDDKGNQTTTTTTTDASGNATTTTTTTPSATSQYCQLNPDDVSCREGDRWNGTGAKAGFGTSNNAQLNQAKIDFQALVNRIKTEAQAMVSGTATVTGTLPCNSYSVLGTDISVCFSDYQAHLETLGAAFVVMALIAVAFMVLL